MDQFLNEPRIGKFFIFYIVYIIIFIPALISLITSLNFINIQAINLIKEFISGAEFHIFAAIWIYYNLKAYNINIKKLIGKTHPLTKYMKYVFLIPFIVLFSINLMIFLIFLISKNHLILEKFNLLNQPMNYYLHFILIVFIAPCVEEIFFRRVMLQRFIIKWGITKAIIYSSLIFMLMHIYRAGFDSLIFSIIVSIIFLKTRMVTVCIFFHSVYNLIVSSIFADQYINLLTHIAGIHININTLADIAKLLSSSKIIVILTIGTIFSILIIVLFLYKNWPKENLETIN